ncbi:hypothetical protein J4482_02300 [Candidatus Woesearchaeota archaeon]|nr:hypothetical protein [Candidatus Woesearchaeota archaeon]
MFADTRFAPLPGSMMALGILGFLVTTIYANVLGVAWSFALDLFFLIIFIASFLSMHYGPLPGERL